MNDYRYNCYINWNDFVGKCYVAITEEYHLECKWTISATGCLLKINIFPLNYQFVSIIKISNLGVVGATSIKICHQWGNVLSGSQPGVDIVSCVEKTSCGNCYVFYRMAIKRKLEAQINSRGPPIGLREHVMLRHSASIRSGVVLNVQVIKVVFFLLYYVSVIFMYGVLKYF